MRSCEYSYVSPIHDLLDFDTRTNGPVKQLDGRWDDLAAYAQRRKPWNRGVSTAAFKDYEDILRSLLRDVVITFEKRQGESVNLAAWMLYTTYVPGSSESVGR